MEPTAINTAFSRFIGFDSTNNDATVTDKIAPFLGASTSVRTVSGSGISMNTGNGNFNNGLEIWTMVATTSSMEMRRNGFVEDTATIGTNRISFEDDITIGRSWNNAYTSSLNIKELLMIKGDVSDDLMETVEWYLADKYGYTLDAGHTYNSSDPTSCNPSIVTPPQPDMTQIWDMYFSAHSDYQSGFNTAVGADGNTYFLSGRDVGNTSNINAHPTSTDISINHGMYINGDGLTNSLNEAASLELETNTDNGSIAHGNGDYTMFVVYNYDGTTNDRNYKHWAGGPKGWKIEGATGGINISDTFNTQLDGSGTASGGETFQFDPANGSYTIATANPFFFCIQRDVTNNKYLIYTGELDTGNTAAADLKIHDTVSDSGWYLTEPFTNNSTEYEFLTDEDSTLHVWGYSPSVVPVADINATYEFLITRF